MKNRYYQKWTSNKEQEIEIFLEGLNVDEMTILITDILKDDSKIKRIFKPPKGDNCQEHIFPLIRDRIGKNENTFMQALSSVLLNAYKKNDYIAINEIFTVLRYFELKIDNEILNSFIINDKLPIDTRKNAALTFAAIGGIDSYKYWKQYNYKKDNFIFFPSLMFIANYDPVAAIEHFINNFSEDLFDDELVTPLRIIFSKLFRNSEHKDDLNKFLPILDDNVKSLLFNEIFKYPEFELFSKKSIYSIAYNYNWTLNKAKTEQSVFFWTIELRQIIFGRRANIISKYDSINDYLNFLFSLSSGKKMTDSNLSIALHNIIEDIFTYSIDNLIEIKNNFLFQLILIYKPDNAKIKLTETVNFLITDKEALIMDNYDFILKESTKILSTLFPSKEATQVLIENLCRN